MKSSESINPTSTGGPPPGACPPGGATLPRKARGPKRGDRRNRYTFGMRLKAVKLFLEEGFTASAISRELGMSDSSINKWVGDYHEHGEAGIKYGTKRSRRPKVAPAVKQKIVELKKEQPRWGIRRISDVLSRFFHLKASPETVRKTLHDEQLMDKPTKKKPKKNPQKPRFFERATPNQLWQTDIFTFRLGGHQAYLIGYIDDYSRYLVGLELFSRQTADNVLELFRRSVSEYGLPKEMLTDNGRQYTNWRGTSRFEKALKQEKIHHLRSRPHHPQTLGKIERFWKTVWDEFLCRAQFESFEEARERIRNWIKYYNHRRPHQGIGGLCPADRFFEVAHEMKGVIERGIEDNILELALRGKPRQPFYMVGRMGGQSNGGDSLFGRYGIRRGGGQAFPMVDVL